MPSASLVAAYGAWLALSRQDLGQLVEIGIWLAAGVIAHDARSLARLLLRRRWLGGRLLPRPAQAPAVIALIVLGHRHAGRRPRPRSLRRAAGQPDAARPALPGLLAGARRCSSWSRRGVWPRRCAALATRRTAGED